MDRCLPLSDERLIKAYEKAIQLDLPDEFIAILKAEAEKRRLLNSDSRKN
ncbi:sporulation histidine kinase inhibitor Sda [Bacillus sp. FJAT-49736]|nr:sporulation histidine kinase inhibitor Sda [Bacillus sp. FJAT-49736]MBS4172605.1 sporulation histidine kinase inhibitor Sda [Bacillus sp. FJAT-49736]